jgi:hypothetical protein
MDMSSSKPVYVFDIETNGLLPDVTDLWVVWTYNIATHEMVEYPYKDMGWVAAFDNAAGVIGHNILGYDLSALEKLHGYRLPKHVKVLDTLLLSLILNYKRFGERGHSLETWGEELGYPKDTFSDFSKYSPELSHRCKIDVELNYQVYMYLMQELREIKEQNPMISTYIKAEHAAARWNARASLYGWPFDLDGAKSLASALEVIVKKAEDALVPLLGTKTVALDKVGGVVTPKTPKWNKDGSYSQNTANYFGVDPWSGYPGEERMIEGPYSRIAFVPLKLSSVDDVKTFLFRHGWVPTEWNRKKDPDTGEFRNTSPKITEDSIEFLGGNAQVYKEYTVVSSRLAILKGLIAATDDQNRVHGDAMLIGTPSMRTTHRIIVNMPSADADWGPEFRRLFKTRPGWKIIGADSSGNQARGLAHYLGDEEYINTLLNGDIHQYNADILTQICRKLLGNPDFVVTRSQAKRILYAFLFGASGAKLWSYIFGILEESNGNKLKNAFVKAVPGFLELLNKLKAEFSQSKKFGRGYIKSLTGARVYVDSMHKLLVYLLQSCEKATCSASLMLIMEKLEEEGIPYEPYIYYHDEVEYAVPEEFEERAKEIGKYGFREGPKLYGIEIMDGDAKSGDTWYDVH